MIILILGENGSGKSVYAEKLTVRLCENTPYYIATMIPYGNEGRERVGKHRKQRESMGFFTVEKPINVSDISFPQNANVLLEDVSNLLGNALFSDFEGKIKMTDDEVFEDIAAMCAKCETAVLVSIDGLIHMSEYDKETHGYIDSLNQLNRRLSDTADVVISMKNGAPTLIKGDLNAIR